MARALTACVHGGSSNTRITVGGGSRARTEQRGGSTAHVAASDGQQVRGRGGQRGPAGLARRRRDAVFSCSVHLWGRCASRRHQITSPPLTVCFHWSVNPIWFRVAAGPRSPLGSASELPRLRSLIQYEPIGRQRTHSSSGATSTPALLISRMTCVCGVCTRTTVLSATTLSPSAYTHTPLPTTRAASTQALLWRPQHPPSGPHIARSPTSGTECRTHGERSRVPRSSRHRAGSTRESCGPCRSCPPWPCPRSTAHWRVP